MNFPLDLQLVKLPNAKFAGWFDLYSKKFYEELVPVWKEWSGYGAWDYYSMMVADVYKQAGGDFNQYVLEGETIADWALNPWNYNLASYYREALTTKETPNYGALFQEKVYSFVKERISKFNINKKQ